MDDQLSIREKFKIWFSVMKSITRLMFNQPVYDSADMVTQMPRPDFLPPGELPDFSDDEIDAEAEDMLSNLSVVTVTYDSDVGEPVVDLGDTNPVFAASMLNRALEAMESTFPYPKIMYRGHLFFDPNVN